MSAGMHRNSNAMRVMMRALIERRCRVHPSLMLAGLPPSSSMPGQIAAQVSKGDPAFFVTLTISGAHQEPIDEMVGLTNSVDARNVSRL